MKYIKAAMIAGAVAAVAIFAAIIYAVVGSFISSPLATLA